jgi:vitamin B12 transporter
MLRILSAILLLSIPVLSQDSLSLNLSEIKVSANLNPSEIRKTARNVSIITAAEIEESPVKTIDGILQFALNVDVRSRSPFGVQADVSIRGGHFDQTLVMIDGVKMNDPQTGHHSMNLPVPLEQIERIEVLQGGASRVYGPSAFSGVINIITKTSVTRVSNVGAGIGQYGLSKLEANFGFGNKVSKTFLSASKIDSDGYTTNTAFDRFTGYAKTILGQERGYLSIQGGLMNNKFGASNFYHPKFFKQYEETNSRFLAVSENHNFSNALSGSIVGSIRGHDDLYDFNGYLGTLNDRVNFHKTTVFDIDAKLRYLSELGASSVGLEWRQEGVISNRLGDELEDPREVKGYPDILYTRSKKRQNVSGYLEHQKRGDKWLISGGTLVNFNSQFGTELYPGVDVSYFTNNGVTLYGTANKSLRFPTFTEMYLNTSTVKADPNLLPEKAINYELGFKYFSNWTNIMSSIFYKKTTDAIDKVKRPELELPTVENIDNINMAGFEIQSQFHVAKKIEKMGFWFQKFQINYSYLIADRQEVGFQSFYTLNFLRHKLSSAAFFRIAKGLSASLVYTYKKREGAYQWDNDSPVLAYKTVHLIDARVSYSRKWLNVYIDANNLLDYEYYEFGFVEQPGRWLSTGVKLSF